MNKFTIAVIILLFSACTNNAIDYANQNIIKIDDHYELYRASDIYDSVKLIRLETTDKYLVGEIKKIIVKDEMIYILDDLGRRIGVFDANGEYISKVDKRGNGNGEYVQIDDFSIDNKGNIIVLDGAKRTLNYYDRFGEFTSKHKLPISADAFECYNDHTFLFSSSGLCENKLNIWSIKDEKITNSHLDYDKRLSGRVVKPLIKYSDRILFMQRNDNCIYDVSIDTLTAKWSVDFGNKSIVRSKLQKGFGGAYFPAAQDYYITTFAETDNLVSFSYQSNEQDYPFYVYMSKISADKIVVTYQYNNTCYYTDNLLFNKLPLAPITVTDNNEFVSYINPFRWKTIFKEYNKDSLNKDDFQRWNYIRTTLDEIKEYDNSVIVIYQLKTNEDETTKPTFTLHDSIFVQHDGERNKARELKTTKCSNSSRGAGLYDY